MSGSVPPKVVLVAGMPRSGSTWLFNAARLLLDGQDRAALAAAWVGDYDRDDPAAVHLVKAHRPVDVDFDVDLVLTTWRPYEDCLKSLIRMGWLRPAPAAVRARHDYQTRLYAHWAGRSDLEIGYDQIIADPVRALARVAACLGLPADPGRDARIATTLARMPTPQSGSGHDSRTLLHPGHRSTGQDTGGDINIAALLQDRAPADPALVLARALFRAQATGGDAQGDRAGFKAVRGEMVAQARRALRVLQAEGYSLTGAGKPGR